MGKVVCGSGCHGDIAMAMIATVSMVTVPSVEEGYVMWWPFSGCSVFVSRRPNLSRWLSMFPPTHTYFESALAL